MTKEMEINAELTELFEGIERTLPRKTGEAFRELERSRLVVSDVLAKYTQADGSVRPIHATRVASEIVVMEGEIYRYLRNYLHTETYQVAEESSIGIVEILIAIIGAKALSGFAGIPEDLITAGTPEVATAIFGLLIGMSLKGFSESIEGSVFNRKSDDGKQLNDRLRTLSKSVRLDVAEILRQSIRRGEKVSDIIRKVERKYEEMKWRVRTIIETELLFAHRQAIGKFAEISGIASGIKIVDYPHGKPTVHARHMCYIYARADDHGMGSGVYPVTTRKIRNPHPQCRSTLHLVLADELR